MTDTTTPEPPPAVDHLAAARATRANLEMLGPGAYGQNAPTLIAEAQLDATLALAEAQRALVLLELARHSESGSWSAGAADIARSWTEAKL